MKRLRNDTAAIVLALVFLVSVGSFAARAQIVPGEGMDSGLGGANIISGTVYTDTGRVSTRITIRLTTMMRGDRVGTTDDRGNFVFRGLPAGTYTIVIDKEKDFEPFTQAVDIIQFRGSPPQTYTLSVRLKLKPGTLQKPAVLDASLATLPQAGRELFQKAQDLAKTGDNVGAIEQLLLLTTQFPNFMLGFNELGVEYLKTGQLEKADAALQTAVKLSPDAFGPQMNRGMVLVSLKKYEEAEPVLRNAKTMNDQSGAAHYFLGQALANLGKFDEAEKELTKAISMGGKEMMEAHRILAIIYSSKGDKKRAAVEIETYLKINPSAPDADQLRKALQQMKAQDELNRTPN
jgi:tetratricopeptide (TPR) repeat protein